MSEEFYKTTQYHSTYSFDFDTVADLTKRLIDTGIILIAEVDDKAVGMIAVALVPFMFNRNEKFAAEVVIWVDKEHRSSTLGMQLIKRADKLRLLRDYKAMQLARLSTSPEIVGALYEHLGFPVSEICHTRTS